MPQHERSRVDLSALKETNTPIIFVLGGPCSGKGTQCAKMAEKYDLTHLSIGDVLRAKTKTDSPRGKDLKSVMEAGELVAPDLTLDLLKEAMVKESEKERKGFIIDGHPDLNQAEQFEQEIKHCAMVIYFDVTEETMIERLTERSAESGRIGENSATLRKRVETFQSQTLPVVDYYRKTGQLVQIGADGSVDDVFKEVTTILDPMFEKMHEAKG